MEVPMATFDCKICGSAKVVKNGHDTAGRQKYHCKTCGAHTTTDAAAREYAEKMKLLDKLLPERLSQRALARVTGLSRSTIINYLKKKDIHHC